LGRREKERERERERQNERVKEKDGERTSNIKLEEKKMLQIRQNYMY